MKTIGVLSLILISQFYYAQKEINKRDKNGNKIGYWEEKKNEYTYCYNYVLGLKEGAFTTYEVINGKRQVVSKGFFTKDTLDKEISFFNNGKLKDVYKPIIRNTEYFQTEKGRYKPLFKAYLISFCEGQKSKKCEGFVYGDDIVPFDTSTYQLDYFTKDSIKCYPCVKK